METRNRAGGIIINSKGKIALSYEHLWGFPRGGIEEGEKDIDAAKREIFEEVGLEDIKLITDLGIYERPPFGMDPNSPDFFKMHIHLFLFFTEYTGELNPEDHHVKEAGWFTKKEVLTQLTDEKDRAFFISKMEIIRKSTL